MALNGSGLFNVDSTGQPVVSSTLISASVFNAFTADVATALSNAMYKDGQQTVTANIPMGGYKFTGLAAGANAGESVRYEQLAGSISQAFSAASIDLGHASDTTLSRASAGVVAVEGVNILTTATGAALAGNASQAFSCAAGTGTQAVNKDQADAAYAPLYSTGYGGSVTQLTSKSTAVTLNKLCGAIILHSETLNATSSVRFQFNNTFFANGDVIVFSVNDTNTPNVYDVKAENIRGGFAQVVVRNIGSSPYAEAIKISFAIIKAVTS